MGVAAEDPTPSIFFSSEAENDIDKECGMNFNDQNASWTLKTPLDAVRQRTGQLRMKLVLN